MRTPPVNLDITTLPNNLRVVTRTMPGASSAIGAFINRGSRHENEANNGVAHFLEHMAFKGTDSRTAYDISYQIEILGGESNACTDQCGTSYYMRGLAEHIAVGADIIGDSLNNSKYEQSDVDIESGVILQEISQYEDDPYSTMDELLMEVAFPDQPIGRKILGTKEFVGNAKSQDFRDFIDNNYSGESMIVVAAGGVEHDAVVDVVGKAFAKVPDKVDLVPTTPATYVGGIGIDTAKKFSQVNVGLMWQSVPICDSSRYAHTLLASAFGSGGSSPLYTEIREKRGLVYHTSAHTHAEVDFGLMYIVGMLTPDNLEEFINVACSEFAKMKETINEDNLTRARNSMLVRLAFMEESAMSTMNSTAADLFNYGRVRSFDEIRKEINQVTVADLKTAANRIMSTKPTISLVGPVPDADYEGMVKAAIG